MVCDDCYCPLTGENAEWYQSIVQQEQELFEILQTDLHRRRHERTL